MIRHVGDYRVAIAFTSSRTANGMSSVRLLDRGSPVAGARVRLTSIMETMDMGYTGLLPQSSRGTYTHPWPALEMPGPWRLRLSITPPGGRPFSVTVVAHIA
jgi:hypothetical protein